MSSIASSSSSRMKVLLLLDAYSKMHETGGELQKSCCWSITKARHARRREIVGFEGQLSASHVREDLRARTVVAPWNTDDDGNDDKNNNSPPSLVNDDDKVKTTTTTNDNNTIRFKVVDVVEELERRRQPLIRNDDTVQQDENVSKGGLRQRRGGANEHESKPAVVEEPMPVVLDEEEEELRRMNPLEIIGGSLPPRELKMAQAQARESLLAYVEAANKAAAILNFLSQQKSLQ